MKINYRLSVRVKYTFTYTEKFTIKIHISSKTKLRKKRAIWLKEYFAILSEFLK